MLEYLLIGGLRAGDFVAWPRQDNQPCVFPTKTGTTGLYFRHEFQVETFAYRVASPMRWLYPVDRNEVAFKLLELSSEDLARVRLPRGKSHDRL